MGTTSQQDPITVHQTPNPPNNLQTRLLGHLATLLQLPHLFKSQSTLSERRQSNHLNHKFSSSVNPTPPQSPCLPSWRKFLTPSTTLLPLLATPQFPTSLPIPQPLATRTSLLPTMQSWPAPQRVADFISVTSHTRRPRGSCKLSSRDT